MLSLYRNPVKIARDNDHHFDQGYDDQLCAVPTTQSQSIVLATSSLAYSKQIYLEDYRKQFTLSSQLTNIVIVGVNSSMPILQDYEKFTQSERGIYTQYVNIIKVNLLANCFNVTLVFVMNRI